MISNPMLTVSLLLCSFLLAVAEAQTTSTAMELVGAPSGLSAYDAGVAASGTVQATVPTIYAGTAGTCATTDSNSTCDSCDGTAGTSGSPKWCNQTSVHTNGLKLSITLKSSTTATFQGTPRIRYRLSGGGVTASDYAPDNATAPSLASGVPFTIEILWSKLCPNAGSNATCTTDGGSGVTLSVGIDNNNDGTALEEKIDFNLVIRAVDPATSPALTACPVNTTPASSDQGICDYTVKPGDSKVYITDYAASSNDLLTSNANVKFNRIIMFYKKDVADASTVTNNSEYLILSLKNNSPLEPTISDQRITGLQNDVTYCFALANMDQTGNITYFPPASVLSDATKVCATPSQVVGLLDDKHCFIATATFGSEMAPEVQTFRKFRNEFLLPHALGQFLVKAYYKFGPVAAEWISQSEVLKTLSLWLLWPLLLFAKLSLWLGLLPATLLALLFVVLLKRSSAWIFEKPFRGEA